MGKKKFITEDFANLSKNKYIYLFYRPHYSNSWVKERFPIVYSNKKYVYFKRNGSDALTYISRDNTVDLSEVEARMQEPSVWPSHKVMYFLTPYAEDIDVIEEKVKAIHDAEKREKDRIAAKVSYAASKQSLEKTIANMKRLEELYPELLN